MDGSKKQDTFYQKALDRKLIPHISTAWHMLGDPAAFADLGKQYPVIIDDASYVNANRCAIIDAKNKNYRSVSSDDPAVERLCRGLILKNSLNNL